MEAVEEIGFQVLGDLGRLADPRDQDQLPRLQFQFVERLFENVEDTEIPAAGAPGDRGVV